MSLRADTSQLVTGLLASLYPGHGILGSAVVSAGTNGGSIISIATTVDPNKEYRLLGVSIPSGFTVNEDGSGQATLAGVAVFKLYEDAVEL